MARPPRGRLPGSGRSSDESGDDELPLELPRVDPIRPRVTRTPRTEPKLETKSEEPETEKGPRRFVPPLRAAIPEPPASPRRMTPEQLDNPFDYYAMPKDESDPLSRPIVKPAASDTSEFLTSKYYTPRSDLTAKRSVDAETDQTSDWARSVRPGRPILDRPATPEDDTPLHLRHLPSRVRDHLRTEPKMPSVSETLGSFAKDAPTATQLRARSGVPLPLAPEMRAPVPQDVRVTRSIPDVPTRIEVERDDLHQDDDDRFMREPEFDSSSDEAVTDYERDLPPLTADEPTGELTNQDDDQYDDEIDDDIDARDDVALSPEPSVDDPLLPSWMRRIDDRVVPPPVAVSDWDQDEAMHALTSRIRNRSVEMVDRYNNPRAGLLKKKIFGALGQASGKLREKTRDFQYAREQAKYNAKLKAQEQADAAAQLRASQDDMVSPAEPALVVMPDYSIADELDFKAPRERRSFFKRKERAPVVRVSQEANRAQRRKRQSRLYEDIVAWIVVPPFIIGAIYGGLELAKIISNSPLGKMLSGQ